MGRQLSGCSRISETSPNMLWNEYDNLQVTYSQYAQWNRLSPQIATCDWWVQDHMYTIMLQRVLLWIFLSSNRQPGERREDKLLEKIVCIRRIVLLQFFFRKAKYLRTTMMPEHVMIIIRLEGPTVLPPSMSWQNIPPYLGVEVERGGGGIIVHCDDKLWRIVVDIITLIAKQSNVVHTNPDKVHFHTFFIKLNIGQEVNGWNGICEVHAMKWDRELRFCILRKTVPDSMIMPKIIPIAAPRRPFCMNPYHLTISVIILRFGFVRYGGLGCITSHLLKYFSLFVLFWYWSQKNQSHTVVDFAIKE